MFKLNNLSLFLKYNAILYFYYINSDYRDRNGFDVNTIPSTQAYLGSTIQYDTSDLNIIYYEQIEEVEAVYATENSAL